MDVLLDELVVVEDLPEGEKLYAAATPRASARITIMIKIAMIRPFFMLLSFGVISLAYI